MKIKLSALMIAAGLTAAASPVFAAGTQIYGIINEGIAYQNWKPVSGPSTSSTQLVSGQYLGSRLGIKSEEDLGHGVRVGVQLESGWYADTGMSGQNGRLFGRDARLYMDGDYGFLSAGRMGPIVGGNGPYARFGGNISPISCGWGNIGGHLQVAGLGFEYVDNAIAYASPKFAGWDVTLQYSFGTDSQKYGAGVEGKSSVDRMYSGALRYEKNGVMVIGGIERINFAQPAAREAGLKDGISYNLAGSYETPWARFTAYGQYFENYTAAAKTTVFAIPSGVDGYGFNVGADIPTLGGFFKVALGYADFEGSKLSDRTMKTYQAAVGYTYPLSKRTSVYAGANWITNRFSDAQKKARPDSGKGVFDFTVGLSHKF